MSDLQPPPTYALPVLVEEATGKAIFNPIWLKWFLDLAAILDSIGGTSPQHNSMGGLQGGTTNQYYHLTQARYDTLTGNQSANTAFAGPASGAASPAAFRALVVADLPAAIQSSNYYAAVHG